MNSKVVKKYYDENNIDQLYKDTLKYFTLIDDSADKLLEGDILDEYELCKLMEQMTGCYVKLNPIAGALESMLIEYENDNIVKEESNYEKIRIQDQNSCKAKARAVVSDLRCYASDFSRYCQSAQSQIVTAQSRLKRLTVEKVAKGVDYVGEVPVKNKEESNNNSSTAW